MSAPTNTDFPRGVVPPGRYAGGGRSPIVQVWLCAGCAGFAPITAIDYKGVLSGQCRGCGTWTRETHRYAAQIDSVSGCTCGTHGEPLVGDLTAEPTEHPRDGS